MDLMMEAPHKTVVQYDILVKSIDCWLLDIIQHFQLVGYCNMKGVQLQRYTDKKTGESCMIPAARMCHEWNEHILFTVNILQQKLTYLMWHTGVDLHPPTYLYTQCHVCICLYV